jgi:ABC-2 type transport system permease protein
MQGRRRDSREKGYYFLPRRLGAMVLRYFYLLRGSLPRIIELAYWPTMQMLI